MSDEILEGEYIAHEEPTEGVPLEVILLDMDW